MAAKKIFISSQIEDYRAQLEIKHLRTKNHFVLGIIFLMMLMFLGYMLIAGYPFKSTLPLMVGFLIVLIFNIANLAYGRDVTEFYQLNKYVTTVGIFSLSIGIIFFFKSPSMMIVLFIAYAISAFYQDTKVLFLSDGMMLSSVLLIIINYPQFLGLENATIESRFGIGFFFVMFVIVLSVSNYIIIKQKSFFFNQISSSKESEFRNLDLLIDLKNQVYEDRESVEFYFDALLDFTQAFSDKIESENVFTEKIAILKELAYEVEHNKILEKFPDYSEEDLLRLEDLLVFNHQKLRKSALKIAYSHGVHVEKREIFSETQFKSFNHQTDNVEIKIVSFVLFYTALKKGYAILPGLEEDVIYQALINTDFYYFMDPRIIKIYQNNSEVFDQIIKDAFQKKVKK